jgi:hypothetical protein
MNRRQIEARVQRTQLRWMVARLDGHAVQYLQIILDGAREHELPGDYQAQLVGTQTAG